MSAVAAAADFVEDDLRADPRLDLVFRPRSVALVGASGNPDKVNGFTLRILRRTGYEGTIYPVNPRYEQIGDLKCYPDVASLPEVPDVAVVMVPARDVPEIIEQCGRAGIRAAVVFSSGFEEIAEGKEFAVALEKAAREHGVAVVGPNCTGTWSIRARALLTFAAFATRIEGLRYAPIAMLSQSGAMSSSLSKRFHSRGPGLAYAISVGNETVFDVLDYLAWLIEQDDVKVVLLFAEAIRNGARLVRLAERARQRGIQIVALKTGNSAAGQVATASHTGKMASPYAVYRSVFEQAGIIQVSSLVELADCAEVLVTLPSPRGNGPKGGVSVCSTTGGACALIADLFDRHGVPLATFEPETTAALKKILPPYGSAANPADLTGQTRSDPHLIENSLRVFASEPNTEALVIQFASGGQRDITENGATIAEIARAGGYPLLLSMAVDDPLPEDREKMLQANVMCTRDPGETARFLGWLYRSREYRALPALQRPAPRSPLAGAPRNWAETMALLAASGIRVPAWRALQAGDDAAAALAGLTFPVAAKAMPEDAAHKTELGVVKLNLGSLAEVQAAAAAIRERLGKPGAAVLVQEMAPAGVEVVLAVVQNADFGPVLSIGSGGVATEVFGDVGYLALPTDAAQVKRLLRSLKLWRFLEGFRGAPAADIDALVDTALQLAESVRTAAEPFEIELNPLFVQPAAGGGGVIAVDALVKRTDV